MVRFACDGGQLCPISFLQGLSVNRYLQIGRSGLIAKDFFGKLSLSVNTLPGLVFKARIVIEPCQENGRQGSRIVVRQPQLGKRETGSPVDVVTNPPVGVVQ